MLTNPHGGFWLVYNHGGISSVFTNCICGMYSHASARTDVTMMDSCLYDDIMLMMTDNTTVTSDSDPEWVLGIDELIVSDTDSRSPPHLEESHHQYKAHYRTPTCTFDPNSDYQVDLRPFRSVFSYYGWVRNTIEADELPVIRDLLPLLRGAVILVSLTDISTVDRFYDLRNAYRRYCCHDDMNNLQDHIERAHTIIQASTRTNTNSFDEELQRYLGVQKDNCYYYNVLRHPGKPEIVVAARDQLRCIVCMPNK